MDQNFATVEEWRAAGSPVGDEQNTVTIGGSASTIPPEPTQPPPETSEQMRASQEQTIREQLAPTMNPPPELRQETAPQSQPAVNAEVQARLAPDVGSFGSKDNAYEYATRYASAENRDIILQQLKEQGYQPPVEGSELVSGTYVPPAVTAPVVTPKPETTLQQNLITKIESQGGLFKAEPETVKQAIDLGLYRDKQDIPITYSDYETLKTQNEKAAEQERLAPVVAEFVTQSVAANGQTVNVIDLNAAKASGLSIATVRAAGYDVSDDKWNSIIPIPTGQAIPSSQQQSSISISTGKDVTNIDDINNLLGITPVPSIPPPPGLTQIVGFKPTATPLISPKYPQTTGDITSSNLLTQRQINEMQAGIMPVGSTKDNPEGDANQPYLQTQARNYRELASSDRPGSQVTAILQNPIGWAVHGLQWGAQPYKSLGEKGQEVSEFTGVPNIVKAATDRDIYKWSDPQGLSINQRATLGLVGVAQLAATALGAKSIYDFANPAQVVKPEIYVGKLGQEMVDVPGGTLKATHVAIPNTSGGYNVVPLGDLAISDFPKVQSISGGDLSIVRPVIIKGAQVAETDIGQVFKIIPIKETPQIPIPRPYGKGYWKEPDVATPPRYSAQQLTFTEAQLTQAPQYKTSAPASGEPSTIAPFRQMTRAESEAAVAARGTGTPLREVLSREQQEAASGIQRTQGGGLKVSEQGTPTIQITNPITLETVTAAITTPVKAVLEGVSAQPLAAGMAALAIPAYIIGAQNSIHTMAQSNQITSQQEATLTSALDNLNSQYNEQGQKVTETQKPILDQVVKDQVDNVISNVLNQEQQQQQQQIQQSIEQVVQQTEQQQVTQQQQQVQEQQVGQQPTPPPTPQPVSGETGIPPKPFTPPIIPTGLSGSGSIYRGGDTTGDTVITNLSGQVRDSLTNLPIVKALVRVISSAGAKSQRLTDKNGRYQFTDINPDYYTVLATKEGYDPIQVKKLVNQGENRLDFKPRQIGITTVTGGQPSPSQTLIVPPTQFTPAKAVPVQRIATVQPGVVAVKQGDSGFYTVIYPPYQPNNIVHMKVPPPDALILPNIGSAYKTIVSMGGNGNVLLNEYRMDSQYAQPKIKKVKRKMRRKSSQRAIMLRGTFKIERLK